MTIKDAINNLKRGKCIPYKHETLTLVIESLDAWEKAREEIKYHADNIKYTDAYRDGFEVSLKIIDKHLSELRGDKDGSS